MFSKLFTAPISWLYGLVVDFRNWLYDINLIKSTEFDIPIVCIGNITVGGTGKTPHVEYLIEKFSDKYNVAVISRGYKRKTKGYVLVDPDHTSRQVGDEPKQIKLKFPNIPVAVCANRTEGIKTLRKQFPDINLIIMDDGMQHRKVETWLNIALVDYTRPIYNDYLLPHGSLRDRRSKLKSAQIVIVTKCPKNIQPIDMRLVYKNLKLLGYQNLYFTRMNMLEPRPVFPKEAAQVAPLQEGGNVVLMSGIGNPSHFRDSMSSKYKVIDALVYPDHHSYKTKDLQAMQNMLKSCSNDMYIVTTEKDATKFFRSNKIPNNIKQRLYYQSIDIQVLDSFKNNEEEAFINNVQVYVKKNHKYSVLN